MGDPQLVSPVKCSNTLYNPYHNLRLSTKGDDLEPFPIERYLHKQARLKARTSLSHATYDHIVCTAEPLLMGYVFREELQHRTNS